MNSSRRRRLQLWLPIAAALIVLLAWLFRPQPVGVDLATLERGALQVTVADEGETRVKEVFGVSAPLPGYLRRIELHPGDSVVANQTVIASIEPSDPSFLDSRTAAEARAAVSAAEAARAHATAEVRRAQAELDFAASELTRFRSLAERDATSRSSLDSAERHERVMRAALEEARAGLASRDADLEGARARVVAPSARRPTGERCDCVNVFSPVTGSVLHVLRESEGFVAPGEALIEVGDPHDLEIVVDLLSSDAVAVVPGQRARIASWGGDGPLDGVVRKVEPFGFQKVSALGIEEQRVNVIIDLVSPRELWSRLGHGFRVEPEIVLWEAADVLRVPQSALFRDGSAWAVFAAVDGRAQLRRVEVGHQNGLDAEVVSGLSAGERVVVHPSDRVEPGVRLRERGRA